MHAKPRYTGRHRRPSRLHLLIAGPIVALALALAGCGGADVKPQEPAQADEQNATQSTPEPEPSPESDEGSRTMDYAIGETAVYTENGADVAEITVSNVETYTESRAEFGGEPPKNGSFVKFTVTVTYIGDGTTEYHVNPFNWSVKSDGRVYDSQAIFETVDSKLPATDLTGQGGEVVGDVVFDAPDSGEIRLVPTASFGEVKAFWSFGE